MNKYEQKQKLNDLEKSLYARLNPYQQITHYLYLASVYLREINDDELKEFNLPQKLEDAKNELYKKLDETRKKIDAIDDECKNEIATKKYAREFLISFRCSVCYKTQSFKENTDWDYGECDYRYFYKYNTLVKNMDKLEKIIDAYKKFPETKQYFYEETKKNYENSPSQIPENAIITRVDVYDRVFRIDDLYSLEYWKEATPLEELPNLTIEL